jgi:hypothetical protein
MDRCFVEQAMGDMGLLTVVIRKGQMIQRITSVFGCKFSSPLVSIQPSHFFSMQWMNFAMS